MMHKYEIIIYWSNETASLWPRRQSYPDALRTETRSRRRWSTSGRQ